MAVDFIFVSVILSVIIAIFGIYYEHMILTIFSGLMMLSLGWNITNTGILGTFTDLTAAFGVVLVLFGFFLFIVPSLEYIETNI